MVVGAGPAGATAALLVAEQGLNVLLVEKRQEIGSPVRCAEGINRDVLLSYMEPEKRWISAQISQSQITIADTGEARTFEGEEVGYILERRVFDRTLAERAAAAGASIMLKTTVHSLILENGAVAGLMASNGRTKMEIEARVVIAADGVESRVAHWAGLETLLRPSDCLSCAQYMLAGIDLDP